MNSSFNSKKDVDFEPKKEILELKERRAKLEKESDMLKKEFHAMKEIIKSNIKVTDSKDKENFDNESLFKELEQN